MTLSVPVTLDEALVRPIREIVDPGGKGWQSHAALACVEVVGGNSRLFLDWLARLEVQLGSPVADLPVLGQDVPVAARAEIYRLYTDATRAGYAAGSLSISWDDELTDKAVKTGCVHELEAKVLALYRSRAALPAGLLARIGAILGGGSAAQIEGLGTYFEATGLASQIMVDVLELRGFDAALRRGWNLTQERQLTLPIVKALGLLAPSRREWLHQSLKGQSISEIDELVVRRALYELEDIGALSACTQRARELVEGAWQSLDPILKNSRSKVTIRAFARYVLDWHQRS